MTRRFAILIEGTRGDLQPYVALGKGLQDAGFEVKVFVSKDYVTFVKRFGLDCHSNDYSQEAAMQLPEVMDCMLKGDFGTFVKLLGKKDLMGIARNKPILDALVVALDDFGPDAIICNFVSLDLALAYTFVRNVPICYAQLQLLGVSSSCTYFGLPNFPRFLGFLNKALMSFVLGSFKDSMQQKYNFAAPSFPFELPPINMVQWLREDDSLPLDQRSMLSLTGVDAGFVQPPADFWPQPHEFCGVWKIGAKDQTARFKRRDSFFGKSTEPSDLERFIAAGSPPVYIGWGSMICKSKEHMVNLAVRALKQAKQRGVVLGGWAEIKLEDLSSQELRDYCKSNVLFMQTAPHEYLFPKCACIVHHGGAGTTNASISSGVPTIITPVFFDQWDHSKAINAHNIGVGFRKQLQQINADELAAAIRRCCTDPRIRQNAKAFSDRVIEDGVQRAVSRLVTFTTPENLARVRSIQEERRVRLMAPAPKKHGAKLLLAVLGATAAAVGVYHLMRSKVQPMISSQPA